MDTSRPLARNLSDLLLSSLVSPEAEASSLSPPPWVWVGLLVARPAATKSEREEQEELVDPASLSLPLSSGEEWREMMKKIKG